MRAHTGLAIKAHLLRGAFYLLLLSGGAVLAFFRPEAAAKTSKRTLTFAERAGYQRAIEDVYWRHRIWPIENPDPKPSLDAVMSQAQLEKKVEDYLRNSQALEDYWQRPITTEQLQSEMERMARNTKRPEVLRELFAALENDPSVIAECFARAVLAERLVADLSAHDKGQHFALLRTKVVGSKFNITTSSKATYTLPEIDPCTDDTWTPTSVINVPSARSRHTAVWTGTEMIVWGATNDTSGGRYNPSTDSWTATSTANTPTARSYHTAVWSGSEMIVWGGMGPGSLLNTGGRYNPTTNTWTATTPIGAPAERYLHTAVWSGSDMIVWGGFEGFPSPGDTNTGGRYNPSTDTWTATSIANAPDARDSHTAVYAGSEMIVWGGANASGALNTGGRYNVSWTGTSTTSAPDARYVHTAVWSGSEMIVWGGYNPQSFGNTGGRYDPGTDTWTATSTTNAPTHRLYHTAVWTGSEMIIWGGGDGSGNETNTGGRYNPGTDSWTATSTTSVPDGREWHTAVWTDSEMIVWGGYFFGGPFNTGGRYCAQSGASTPTPTPTATPTLTATVTPTATVPQSPTPTPSEAPCAAFDSQPACNSTVFTQLTDFFVSISGFVDVGSISPSVFTVNAIPADSVSGGGSTLEFHFNASPVIPGQNTMDIPAGAFTCSNSGRGFEGFHCTFTYQPPRSTPIPRPRPTPGPRP